MNRFSSRLIAHRGYMEAYPENSWRGIHAALERGAAWVEFDIQMHSPGRFALLHDAGFQRTAGIPLPLFDASESQLQQISIHEPERLGNKYAPEPLPWLEEVLTRLRHYPSARAMVEIKEESLVHWGLEAVMASLLPLLLPFANQCVLISFSYEALEFAKKHGAIETGWVLHEYDTQSITRASKLHPEYLICDYTRLPRNEPLATGSWTWMVYDITDPKLACHWINRGVDLIETRDIGGLIT